MLPQVKEYLAWSETRESKEKFFPRAFRGSMALLISWFLDFQPPDCEWINFCYFELPGMWDFAMAALEYNSYAPATTLGRASFRWLLPHEPGPQDKHMESGPEPKLPRQVQSRSSRLHPTFRFTSVTINVYCLYEVSPSGDSSKFWPWKAPHILHAPFSSTRDHSLNRCLSSFSAQEHCCCCCHCSTLLKISFYCTKPVLWKFIGYSN